jgi:hypothetical protein
VTAWFSLTPVALAVRTGAQDLTPLTPVVRRSIALPGEPVTSATGLAPSKADSADAEAPGIVMKHERCVRITPSTPPTDGEPIDRNRIVLISTLKQRPDAKLPARLSLRSKQRHESGMVFLVRSDGALAMGPVTGGQHPWSSSAPKGEQ